MNEHEWFIDPREVTIDKTQILGRGQFATVYKGKWRFLDVAVKKFNPDCQPHDRIHLKKEIDILVKMHHPHIVQILGVSWNPFMLILEWMPRGNLRQNMQKMMVHPWCLSFSKKKKWSIQLCIALIYLHERKPQYVIHRDIKPTNILMDEKGNLKISDFGISKLMDMSLNLCNRSFETDLSSLEHTPSEEVMTKDIGTLYFMAPEVLDSRTKSYDTRVDIWGLGCTLYEIWEHKPLYTSCTVKELYSPTWEPVFTYTPSMLQPLICGCLELNPESRPEARAILDVLHQISVWTPCG
jgi:serine/threonine protein kinase